jgi:hypothetical protein
VGGLLPNSNYRVFTDAVCAADPTTGRLVVTFNDARTGTSTLYAVHQVTPGVLSSWSAPALVKPGAGEQFFPWMSSAPNGRIDVVFYDRSCDPADMRNCVTLASTTDGGATWTSAALAPPFDGDMYEACVAFLQPSNCGTYFLGDYIGVASNSSTTQVLYTGNGQSSMDILSVPVTFH